MMDFDILAGTGKLIIDNKHSWGDQLRIVNKYSYCLKILRLKYPNIKGSYHKHLKKRETWFVLEGVVYVKILRNESDGIEYLTLYPGDKLDISDDKPHQFWCSVPSIIIEVSTHDNDKDTYRYNEKDGEFYNEDGDKYISKKDQMKAWHKELEDDYRKHILGFPEP